jgi:transcriptional regulator with XRE-family HTH domain
MKDMKRNIGLRIKHLRTVRSLTQANLAEAVGVSTEAISNMERGVNYPSFENLVKISEILRCALVDIFDGVEKPYNRATVEGKILAAVKSLPNDKLDLAMKLISVLG